MKFSLCSLLLAASAVAAPAQLESRALTDADILNFALTLEHLEATFYREAVAKFGLADYKKKGYHNRFYSNTKVLSYDETTHVKTLTQALKAAGAKPVPACKYDFTAALANVETYAATSAILEGVGITAYLGAAKAITSPEYLTAAGSILTVESRHSAYVRNVMKTRPFPAPFDTPLNPQQVITLASPFIKSCPFKLPFAPSPALTLQTGQKQPIAPGMSLNFDVAAPVTGDVYGAWPTVLGPIFTKATIVSSKQVTIPVPKGLAGQSYVILTSSNKAVTAGNTIAGPGIVFVK